MGVYGWRDSSRQLLKELKIDVAFDHTFDCNARAVGELT